MEAMLSQMGGGGGSRQPALAAPAAAPARPAVVPQQPQPMAAVARTPGRMMPPPMAGLLGPMMPPMGTVEGHRSSGLGSGMDGVAEFRPGSEREVPFPPPPVPPERPAAPPPVLEEEVPVLDVDFDIPAEQEGDVAEVEDGVRRIVVDEDPKPKRGGGRKKK